MLLKFSVIFLGIVLFFSSASAQPDSLWSTTLDFYLWDTSESVIKVSDGYIVTGYSHDADFNYYVMTFKVDLDGALQWSEDYADPELEYLSSSEVLPAPGVNQYYIFGEAQPSGGSYTDLRILKIDGLGNLLDEIRFGEPYEDWVHSAAQTFDGGYIITGDEGNYPAMDVFLIKTDSELNVEWRKSYGSTEQDNVSTVIQTSDGGFLVAGRSYSSTYTDCYLLKTDATGNVEFETTYASPMWDEFRDICEAGDGSFYAVWVKHDPSPYSTSIVNIDAQGKILWSTEYLSGNGTTILLNNDGTLGVAGEYNHYLWLLCADELGNELWETRLHAGTYNHVAYTMCYNDVGGYLVVASKNPSAGATDVWLVNFDYYTGIEQENHDTEMLSITGISPNPSLGPVDLQYNLPQDASVEISIFDGAGRLIDSFEQESVPAGACSFCWNPEETLPAGCYTVVLQALGITASERCVILR